jgi:hypothetical protein
MLLSLLIYAVSCTNPEDRATGNPDKTNFNTDENKQLNTASSLDNTNTNRLDTSANPATSKENSNSTTTGTNRTYGTTGDSARH